MLNLQKIYIKSPGFISQYGHVCFLQLSQDNQFVKHAMLEIFSCFD